MIRSIVNWFIPKAKLGTRTDQGLARVFIFTHLFGPIIAQPMWLYLWVVSGGLDRPVAILMASTLAFGILPFLLKRTGSIQLVSMLSFQLLAMTSLYASYHYGGFNSPFIQWLIVSLLLGLFYQAKNAAVVIALFGLDVLLFGLLIGASPVDSRIPIEQLDILRWLSTASAATYMTWMALYYSRVVGLRAELEGEAKRSRATFQKLQEARATREEVFQRRARFFSKISHELRTPLNAIIGYSEILIEDLEDRKDTDEENVRDVSRIMAAGKHLLSLVSTVLDSKSIESSEEQLDIATFKLGALCDEVVASALPMVEQNHNRFVVHCPNREAAVESDAMRLRQVLLNLLSNAAKFTSHGVVKFELDVTETDAGGVLRAAVADTGIGMTEEATSRVFLNYEQAETDTASKYGGTGIGLPLSQHLCNLLGGEITVASSPGKGSCFIAWVPAQHRSAAAKMSAIVPSTPPAQPDPNRFGAEGDVGLRGHA